MEGGNSHIQEEMREVEEELEEDSSTHDTQNPRGHTIPLEALEEGKASFDNASVIPSSPSRSTSLSKATARSSSPRPGAPRASISFPLSQGRKTKTVWTTTLKERTRQTIQLFTSPVFAQAFILTFLGEWGDRSQITTIAMAGANVSGTSRAETKRRYSLTCRASPSLPLAPSSATACARSAPSWADGICRRKSRSSIVSCNPAVGAMKSRLADAQSR